MHLSRCVAEHFSLPGGYLPYLPGYFFARSLGVENSPFIVFVPENWDIRTKEKGRRSLRSVAFFVCLAGQGGVHIP